MKLLCYNKYIVVFLLLVQTLYGSLDDKSAIFYLGEKISYPMVGIHDYIVVDPKKTKVYTHGFKIYKHKMYAHLNLNTDKELLKLENKIQKLTLDGYENFFFDVQKKVDVQKLTTILSKLRNASFLKDAKFMLHLREHKKITTTLGSLVNSFVFYDLLKQADYKEILQKYAHFSKDMIDIERSHFQNTMSLQKRTKHLEEMGLIPYITVAEMDIYGYGSKNAQKREILTLIDDSSYDRIVLSAHQYGALPLEYYGYIQKLYDIKQGLPDLNHMTQYAGVVIWLNINYASPQKLVAWVKELASLGIPVAFANNFGFNTDKMYVQQLGIDIMDGDENVKKKITHLDSMMNYEIDVKLNSDTLYFQAPKNSKPIFIYEDSQGLSSTPAAITPWGGYAISDSFMVEIDGENIWVINPFLYFKEALRLKPLSIPDTTTENGNRLFFTHIDGDGFISFAEFNPELTSGDVMYEEILKKYKVPHSVSTIGSEILPNGLYPDFSKHLLETSMKIYALQNVEAATHTFTHPFFWGKIKNGDLKEEYRLKPPNYTFDLRYEIQGMLDFINRNLLTVDSPHKAKAVFWSGDCAPREDALEFVYKNNIYNINGGYTIINNSQPWLTLVGPLGLERGEYHQIYTGAQNENVFTNDWLGPFWGFKKVVQTFKLTDKPKRLKPINLYYHLYSASKKASLNALRYNFDWVLKQEILPIYTSEYIPKAMDFFSMSVAKENEAWLVDGMKYLKTLRLETKNVDLSKSPTVAGTRTINESHYIALDQHQRHMFYTTDKKEPSKSHLVSANAQLKELTADGDTTHYLFHSYVAPKLSFYVAKACSLESKPKAKKTLINKNIYEMEFEQTNKVRVDVRCR